MFEIIEKHLINIEKSGRYIGNESGIPDKDFKNSFIKFAICYPDLYEIGMSNLGIKIIYDIINKLEFACCERVFSPWLDMEELLIKKEIPLFSLESKTPINDFDILGISMQYELLFSNFLNILKLSKIPIFNKNREEDHPIIILGGPGIANPVPYFDFADLFFIGEAENEIENILNKFKNCKQNKLSRLEKIKELSKIDYIYSPLFPKNKVKRAIYKDFSTDTGIDTYINPVIDIVQNKLSVEIMRGCPHKCRFCQASTIYKPYREKSLDTIITNINKGIKKLGCEEVTFLSLSSADYSNIIELAKIFSFQNKEKKISFSIPSIRVESFDKELLPLINSVRKSGLTFAIESGSIEGQTSINKIVDLNKIIDILQYAQNNGWRVVKFYFMIGLPHIDNEVHSIIKFIDSILNNVKKIEINLNIATFIPKPHTPYETESQLSLEDAIKIFEYLKYYYKKSRVKLKFHNPYMSYLEGIIARGDRNVGLAVYDAFLNGAKFDGWDDSFNFEIYKKSFEKYNITYDKYLSKNIQRVWDIVDIGIREEYFKIEKEKSKNRILTPSCKEKCEKECGLCSKNIKKIDIKDRENTKKIEFNIDNTIIVNFNIKTRYILEFSKKNLMKYIGHIDTIKYFEKLFYKTNISLIFTEGFNPHPKFQFSSPLPFGIESNCEILEFFTTHQYETNSILETLKKYQHKDIPINKIKISQNKKISIIESISKIEYILKFENKFYHYFYDIINNYNLNPDNYKYKIEKNNNIFENNYSNYLKFLDIHKNYFIIEEINIRKKDKILNALNNIFKLNEKDIKYSLIKKNMYINNIELFEYL